MLTYLPTYSEIETKNMLRMALRFLTIFTLWTVRTDLTI